MVSLSMFKKYYLEAKRLDEKGMLETELPQFLLAANSVKNLNDLKREEYESQHGKAINPSDRFDDGDVGVALKTKPKTKRPPLYKVMLLNDDYTPMEFVVLVLERFFGIGHGHATEIMLTVHKKGLSRQPVLN